MDSSIFDEFQVVESPISTRRIDFDEFSAASTPMESTYCRLISEKQYEAIGESETDKELKLLVDYLEKNPSDFIKLMRKRKIEELENAGFFSLLKCKVMTKLKGEEYVDGLVSSDNYKQRLQELTNGMLVVHNYAKETRRCSARLAEKRCRMTADIEDNSDIVSTPVLARRSLRHDEPSSSATIPVPTFMPPPPPPPPLPDCIPSCIAPLKEKNNILTKSWRQCSVKLKKISSSKLKSTEPLQSLHEELTSADPVKRLRSTPVPRSPGGTPIYIARGKVNRPSVVDNSSAALSWKSPLDSPEPLHAALLRIFEQKFRNVRSPSPSSSIINSPSAQPFSP